MDFRSELNNELVMDTVNKKIQKNIFDIIFQHLQDMVFVMKVEEGPSLKRKEKHITNFIERI